jgi:hypothetical protein
MVSNKILEHLAYGHAFHSDRNRYKGSVRDRFRASLKVIRGNVSFIIVPHGVRVVTKLVFLIHARFKHRQVGTQLLFARHKIRPSRKDAQFVALYPFLFYSFQSYKCDDSI